MALRAFTACMHVRIIPSVVQTVLSYSSSSNDNELMISVGFEVGLWIGSQFVNFPLEQHSSDWVNYCVTWASHGGSVQLSVDGMVGERQNIQSGYEIEPRGLLILGNDKDGFLGISEFNAFVGHMTDVNVWDYVLSPGEIREQAVCGNSTQRGNVLSWGVTPLSLYGGVRLGLDHGCP